MPGGVAPARERTGMGYRVWGLGHQGRAATCRPQPHTPYPIPVSSRAGAQPSTHGVNDARTNTNRPFAPNGENGENIRVPPNTSGFVAAIRSG